MSLNSTRKFLYQLLYSVWVEFLFQPLEWTISHSSQRRKCLQWRQLFTSNILIDIVFYKYYSSYERSELKSGNCSPLFILGSWVFSLLYFVNRDSKFQVFVIYWSERFPYLLCASLSSEEGPFWRWTTGPETEIQKIGTEIKKRYDIDH